MNTIKLNNTTFDISSFNKTTYFNGTLTSAATCNMENTTVDSLIPFMTTPITTLQIYYNDILIYNLQDINAKVDAINEVLDINRIGITINLTFNPPLDNE